MFKKYTKSTNLGLLFFWISSISVASSANYTAGGGQITDSVDSIAIGNVSLYGSSSGIILGHSPSLTIPYTGDAIIIGSNANAAAENYYQIALGSDAYAGGGGSIAIGRQSSSATFGIAIGYDSSVTGSSGISLGRYSSAGMYGISIGYDIDTLANQYAIGKYNNLSDYYDNGEQISPIFMIGNGSSNVTRSNVFTIYADGSTRIRGDLLLDGSIKAAGSSSQLTVGTTLDNRNGLFMGRGSKTVTPNATYNSIGNQIMFSDITGGVAKEDFIGYKAGTFYFADSVGGSESSDPNVVVLGNLGVGTASPQRRLDVRVSSGHAVRIGSSSQYIETYHVSSGGPGARNSLLFYNGAFEIFDQTANSSRLWISQSGNIGVGVTDATEKLHVAGNLFIEGSLPASSANIKTSKPRLRIEAYDLELFHSSRNGSGQTENSRAMVHLEGDRLALNFNGDYEGGIILDGPRVVLSQPQGDIPMGQFTAQN